MLFSEFAQTLGYERDIAQARSGTKPFPVVANAEEKILRKLRSEVDALRYDSDLRSQLLDLCGTKQVPPDLSYYLVDDVFTQTCGKVKVHWTTQVGPKQIVIASFILQTQVVTLGGQTFAFVEGAEFESGIRDDITETVLTVLAMQKEAGLDVFDRWCYGYDDWRRAHPICPACGAPIRPYSTGDHTSTATCYNCSWEPSKKYAVRSDFANVESMKAERKQYQKVVQRRLKFKGQNQELSNQIDNYIRAATHTSPKNELFEMYLEGIREAQKSLKDAENAMLNKIDH